MLSVIICFGEIYFYILISDDSENKEFSNFTTENTKSDDRKKKEKIS